MTDSDEKQAKVFAGWWARDRLLEESCTLSPTARAVLLAMTTFTNAAYFCLPSIDTLANLTGRKPRAVQYAIGELEAGGYVRKFAGGKGPKDTNGYLLAVDRAAMINGNHPKGAPGCTLTESTRVHGDAPLWTAQTPEVIHKGARIDTLRVHGDAPEVDSEVSRKRARVFSPPEPNPSGEDSLSSSTVDGDAIPGWFADRMARIGTTVDGRPVVDVPAAVLNDPPPGRAPPRMLYWELEG